MNTSTIATCINVLLITLNLANQPLTAQNKTAKIDALVGQYVANGQFNGTVLVAEHGQVIFRKGYGMANMEWKIANAPDTKFRLGSITKQFTAMLIMQLAEQGKLNVAGKITDYLPDYPKATGSKITIHHLLTHTSGIPNYTSFPTFFRDDSRDPYTPKAFTKKFADLPLEFEPGSTFAYSNSGYFLLGLIIEKVTGKSYADVLSERITTPLKLVNTGYDLSSPLLAKRAAGYEKRNGGYVNAPYLDMSIPYAAGSLYSTVDDLSTWDQALYSDKLLPATAKTVMFTPFLSNYAYGWGIGKVKVGQLKDSLLVIEHGGGINGFNTMISRMPRDRQLIVLLNNTGGAPLDAMKTNIVNILYNQPVETPKKPAANLLRQSVLSEPVAQVKQKFATWKANKAYSLTENDVNELGYTLMGEGKLPEAITVFTLNTDAYPASYNAYDSRGEAYLKAGDKPAAIRDYKKSVELNPRNTNGLTKLSELGEVSATPAPGVVAAADTAVLQSYVGTYELAPSFAITVSRENARLFARATGQDRFELFPESKAKFYYKVVDAQVSFVADEKGTVEQLILHQNGRDMPGKRLH